PDPVRGLLPGNEDGIFDPNISHSGTAGVSFGPYVLNLLVQADNASPQVVSVSPASGDVLPAPPTDITIRFDEAVNVQLLAYQAFQQTSQDSLRAVYIQAEDGTHVYPRLLNYDEATNQATFGMLDGLANGAYTLHLAGGLGLVDLAGNPLVGTGDGGDYVTSF